jgi:glutamine---fructose-6-phosphate transaminase (isomerizing)
MTLKSLMRQEEIPAAIERLLSNGASRMEAVAREALALNPRFLVTVARGSSDHACTYLKYASELPVGPSVASIYGTSLLLEGSVCISVSQSGKSPDIVAMTRMARENGAYAVAVTNDAASPLSEMANATLDIHAGPELSVVATKTFVTSAVAGLWLLAEMKSDEALLAALKALQEAAARAVAADWSPVIEALQGGSLYTLGRGPTWAMANEAALKFKETCQIHAESYSSAEVMHGPVSIVDAGFPVLAFAAGDAAEDSVASVADGLAARGANVFVSSRRATRATVIDHVRTGHWLLDPLALIISFYGMVETVAVSRGGNPDVPRHLNKVTETI